MLSYSQGIFNKMFYLFIHNLNSINRLIVSGYGFGDQGINSQIIHWMDENKNNRIIIIHKNPTSLMDSASYAIKLDINSWEQQTRICWIEKYFGETKLEELKTYII